MMRLIRDIAIAEGAKVHMEDIKFKPDAILALREASEAYLIAMVSTRVYMSDFQTFRKAT